MCLVWKDVFFSKIPLPNNIETNSYVQYALAAGVLELHMTSWQGLFVKFESELLNCWEQCQVDVNDCSHILSTSTEIFFC